MPLQFPSAAAMFEYSYRDRDTVTGALSLPLTWEHIVSPLPALIFEIGQRLPQERPADVVVRAELARINAWGCAPDRFGPVKPEWGGPPDWPGIKHEDAMLRFVEDIASLLANPLWRGLIGPAPDGENSEQLFDRFWWWWAPRAEAVLRERDEELATRSEPRDPVFRLILDTVRPQWRLDKRPDPHGVLAYRFEVWKRFFHESPDAMEKHFRRTLDAMLPGFQNDAVFGSQLRRMLKLTKATREEIAAGWLAKLGTAAPRAARAMKSGKKVDTLFGPVEVDAEGKIKAHIDRDGLAGADEVCRELNRERRAELSAGTAAAAYLREARSTVESARDAAEQRAAVERVQQLRATFEAEDDRPALAFIDWRSGTIETRSAAAKAHGVSVKRLRDAHERVEQRARQLGLA